MQRKVEILIGDRKYKINIETDEDETKIKKIEQLVQKKMEYVGQEYGAKDIVDILAITCFSFAGMLKDKDINEKEVLKELENIKSILEDINR